MSISTAVMPFFVELYSVCLGPRLCPGSGVFSNSGMHIFSQHVWCGAVWLVIACPCACKLGFCEPLCAAGGARHHASATGHSTATANSPATPPANAPSTPVASFPASSHGRSALDAIMAQQEEMRSTMRAKAAARSQAAQSSTFVPVAARYVDSVDPNATPSNPIAAPGTHLHIHPTVCCPGCSSLLNMGCCNHAVTWYKILTCAQCMTDLKESA